jgi:Secretion system C-terminal sorting domain
MIKRLHKIGKGIAAMLLALGSLPDAEAQCGAGPWTNAGTITPALNWQIIPAITGGQYYSFNATAGTPYSFSFCLGGGAADPMADTQITIQTNAGVPVGGPTGFNDDACGLPSHLTYWIAPSTATYRVLVTEFNCVVGAYVNTLAYKSEVPLGTGNVCASSRVIPSLPFAADGLATCGRGDTYTSALPPMSPYMDGEDMIFSYAGTAGQCLSIILSNTYADVGLFLYNGCPSSGGTCIASNVNSLGNPAIQGFTLLSTTTYYILVSNLPGWNCTPFDIDVVACPPPPVTAGSTCGNAYVVPSLPFERLGYTTCGYGNDYTGGACVSPYLGGEDYVFSYTVAGPQCIDIRLSGTDLWVGVFVTRGCPNLGGSTCIDASVNPSGNTFSRFVNLPVAGTYYIVIDTWPTPTCTDFNIHIDPCSQPCASSPVGGDLCSTAPLLSNPLDSICGVTSPAPVYNADSPGNLASNFCGSIENNQWFRFQATATTMTLNVDVSSCANSFGIQAQIFSTPNCTNFTPIGTCYNPMGPWDGVISASGLTIGSIYYLMVDGFAGDECNFLITNSQLLPVEFSDLTFDVSGDEIILNWSTLSEQQNAGFYVQRGEWYNSAERLSIKFQDISFIEGQGNSTVFNPYTYTDQPEWQAGKYYYRIRQVDLNGSSSFSNIVEVTPSLPEYDELLNVYPNPANESVKVEYLSNGDEKVAFEIYDFTGHLVRSWSPDNGMGIFTEELELNNLADGVYLLTYRTATLSSTRKLTIVH